VVLMIVSPACRPQAVPTPQAEANPCLVSSSAMPIRDTIVVALPGSEIPRFVERHLSPSVSLLDCRFQPVAPPPSTFALSGDSLLIPGDSSLPVLRLKAIAPGADPRDLIDRGADVVVTTRGSAIEYARSRGDVRLVPLAWSTIYVIGFPREAPPVELTARLREEIARDAMRGHAIPADSLGWWGTEESCRVSQDSPVYRLPGIGISDHDPIARAVAERLVAVVGPAGPRRLIPFSPTQFDTITARGAAAAFVFPLPRLRPGDCEGITPLPPGWRIEPLIQIRATAIVRPGVPAFLITADGIRFGQAP
jgi:hypothetical protein